MNDIFKNNLSLLKRYNNLVMPETFDVDKRVLIVHTSGTMIYLKNTIIALQNPYVGDVIIYSYIYISEEKIFKFKLTKYNNKGCTAYLNNFLLFDNSNDLTKSESDFIYLPKNVYLLSIKINDPNNTGFEMGYQNFNTNSKLSEIILSSTWNNIDNLLLTKELTIDKKYLIPHFMDPDITQIYDPSNSNIQSYFNSIQNQILDYYNTNIYNTLTSPSPVNGVYGQYNISDTNWNNMTNTNTEYPSSVINIAGKCLDVDKSTKYADKSKVQIWDCNNGDNQKFIYNPKTLQLKLAAATNKCLDYAGGTDSKTIHVWGCSDDNNNQKFNYNQQTGKFQLYGLDNKCLDLNGNNTSNGTQFSAGVACGNNDNAQRFTFKDINVSGGVGKDINIKRVRDYQSAKYGGSDIESLVLEETKNVGDIRGYSDEEIKKMWTNIECNTDISNIPNIDTLKYVPYKKTSSEINKEINSYKRDALIKNLTHDNSIISKCYSDKDPGSISSLVMTQADIDSRDQSVIYSNVIYPRNRKWVNKNITLEFQNDGNLLLKKDSDVLWSPNQNQGYGVYHTLRMQRDGNLVLYDKDGIGRWSSGTNGTSATHARLSYNGYLVIMNHNSNIIRGYPLLIKEYIKQKHWQNSPNKLILNYVGKAWGVQDWAFDDFSNDSANKSCDPWYGFRHDEGNSFWETGNGLTTRRNLNHVEGYNVEKEKVYPSTAKGENYQTVDDRERLKKSIGFYKDIAAVINLPEETTGIRKEVANYIPGYVRQTTDNRNMVCKARDASRDDHGFVLFYQHTDKNDYAKDLLKYNSKLVENLLNSTYVLNYIANQITGFGDDRWAKEYKDTFMQVEIDLIKDDKSGFINKENYKIKSKFMNKLNNSIKENFEASKVCDLTDILNDTNCNSNEINIYKNYINSMNEFCLYKNNSLSNICLNYSNKEYKLPTDETIKIDTSGKDSIDSKRSGVCEENVNWENDLCISLNVNKPDVIKTQIENIDPDSPLYTKLSEKYGNELLFQECLKNPLNKNCNELFTIDKYKNELTSKKKEICLEDTNVTNSTCIDYNLSNKEQLESLTALCKADIKNINCNKIYDLKKDDVDFQSTDIYKGIWFDRNQWWMILLVIIIFCSLIGGKLMLSKKKVNIQQDPIMQQMMPQQMMSQQMMPQQMMPQQPMVQQQVVQQPMMQQQVVQQPIIQQVIQQPVDTTPVGNIVMTS